MMMPPIQYGAVDEVSVTVIVADAERETTTAALPVTGAGVRVSVTATEGTGAGEREGAADAARTASARAELLADAAVTPPQTSRSPVARIPAAKAIRRGNVIGLWPLSTSAAWEEP